MHFTEGKRARDKKCDKESDAADDAAKTKDGFKRKVHSFGVVLEPFERETAYLWMTLRLATEEEEDVPLFMTDTGTASYRVITTHRHKENNLFFCKHVCRA